MRWTKTDAIARINNDHGLELGMKDVQKVANNTFRYQGPKGLDHIRLHATDILIQDHKKGRLTVNTGGWNTLTTRDRIHSYLPSKWYCGSEKGICYITTPSGRFPIGDKPVTFDRETGKCLTKKALLDVTTREAEKKLISAFAKEVKDNPPQDGAGDPWLPVGKLVAREVALDWLKSRYVTYWIVMSALTWKGYRSPSFAATSPDIRRNAVRDYLKASLGHTQPRETGEGCGGFAVR